MQQLNEMQQAMLSQETRQRQERMYKEQIDRNNKEAIERYASSPGGIDSKGKLKATTSNENESKIEKKAFDKKVKTSGVAQTLASEIAEMDRMYDRKRPGSTGS